ncbi:MAG: transporter [Nitrospinae bacterium]|nr:transporter [Nitrospinota bacterium]
MIDFLIENPLVLLFLVAAVGYPLGQIRFKGISLGISAVLFAGIAFGSLHPNMKLPDIVYVLGLALFVYTVGLSSGASFFSSFRRDGMRNNLLTAVVLALGAALTIIAAKVHHINGAVAAGMFAGSLTNTPALAGVLDTIKHNAPNGSLDMLLAEPVMGYSVAYPMGVIGAILAISILKRVWKVDFADEAKRFRNLGVSNEPLQTLPVRVLNQPATSCTIRELVEIKKWDVVFGRIKRGEHFLPALGKERLLEGDIVTLVGTAEELEGVAAFIGKVSREHIELDRSEFDFRRIFVSNPAVGGRKINELDLENEYGAVISRIRRGDADMLPHPDTVLELGDRVRVVAHRERMDGVSRFLGDSYKGVSEVDLLTFSLGLALGLVIGAIPLPLGSVTMKLGFAGGPLLVGLALGAIGHTGRLTWNIPYSANTALRQMGLVLFLAGIGTRAGYGFVHTFSQGGGVMIFLAGTFITCATVLAMLWAGHKLLKIPYGLLAGMTAGMLTQPAVLGFAQDEAKNAMPNIGYASVYPFATVFKILLAQLLLTL